MTAVPDWLRAVIERPGDGRWGRSATWLEETDSTNRVAADEARHGAPTGHLVVADAQSAGRGRFGRSWSSEPGANLLVSIIVRPGVPMARWGWIPLAAGLATAAAAEAAVPGLDVRLKWPNDVRVAGRKLAGILCEARAESGDGFVVIGIGLNVNQSAFDGVHGAPTSLRLEAGRTVPRGDALSRLCDHAEVDVTTGISAPETSRKRYLERLEGVGEPVTVSGPDGVPRGSGVLAGVGALGELMLHTAEGPRTFASGDVTLRPFTL